MSFEDIWQEHRGFILSTVGGLVVFLAGWGILSSMYSTDITQAHLAARSSERKAAENRLPSGKVSEVESRLNELEEKTERLQKELVYRPQPGFTLAGVTKSTDIHFNDVVSRMMSDVVETALNLDLRVPSDLGLAGVTPRTDSEREWYLNGLDLVNRICLAGMTAGVRTIEPIQISKPPSTKDKRGNERPYLREVTVSFSSIGHPAAIDRMVRLLMLPETRLIPDRSTITSLDDPTGKKTSAFSEQVVRLDMTVKALLIDSEGTPARPTAPRQ